MSSGFPLDTRRRGFPVSQVAVMAMVGGLYATLAIAETQARKRSAADALVSEALSHEIYGLEQERDQLLARAVSLSPDHPAAHWHQGRVWVRNQWLPVTGPIETDRQRQGREAYQQRRSETPDTADGHLALADWCASHRLPAQETAHLNRVLQLAPDQVAVRQRLGYQRVSGTWVRGQDLWQGLQLNRQTAQSLDRWRRKLDELRRNLGTTAPALAAHQIERVQAELTADAVPAVELVLGTDSEPAARAGVQLLGSLGHHTAAAALARQAVLSPWPDVRAAAATQLQTRPRDHYVPLLLSAMSTPVESRYQALVANGRLLYRHEFVRETQDQRHAAVWDTVTVRRAGWGGLSSGDWALAEPSAESLSSNPSPAAVPARAVAATQATAYVREWMRLRQNQTIEALNERVCEALRMATGETLPSTPTAWWSWWDSENEVALTGPKPTELRYQQEVRSYADAGPGGSSPSSGRRSSPPPGRAECFVAGTTVWTIAGPVGIEQIRVGDLVLSQDPDTGELAFQPVVQTSERAPEPLLQIRLVTRNKGLLEGSGGHPLWVAGEGWVKLRDLRSGMVLHGVDAPAVISEVAEGSTQPTYNLVVSEFHSYVVGPARVLCHDNTPRRPTNCVVPGLAPHTR